MKETLKYAFLKTVPVLCGYLFLGFAFGLLLQQAGYSAVWSFFSSLLIYAGSIQFVLISFFQTNMALPVVAVMTLLINGRHIFYGLSFLDKFKAMGKMRPYMIFSLTDETYSLLCSEKTPPQYEENTVFFLISLLDQCYWILGSVLGAFAGQIFPFDTTGIDFAMTALFVVIFVEQWLEAKTHLPAVVGVVSAVLCLLIFEPGNFIVPALILSVTVLLLLKHTILKKEGGAGEACRQQP